MQTIEQIEEALIARLAPLLTGYTPVGEEDPAAWRSVRAIKSYQGELEDEAAIARAVRLLPAVYVVYGGSDYAAHGARKVERMRWLLFVLDKNLRGDGDARRAGPGNPGCYALLAAIRDLLVGAQPAAELYPLELLREEPVWFGSGVSVYSAEYETAQPHLYP